VGGSPDQIIDAICSHLEMHGCAFTGCRENMKQNVDTYNLWGCGDEWLEVRACTLRDPAPCGSASCFNGDNRFQRCIDAAEICVRGNTPGGGCVMGCEEGWAVECKPSGGGVTCVCTSGRSMGRSFEIGAPCQSEDWMKNVRAVCQ
jgi:hypothetical protein